MCRGAGVEVNLIISIRIFVEEGGEIMAQQKPKKKKGKAEPIVSGGKKKRGKKK